MTEYLIVGGGSAGAALAARLSEVATNQVTLLEAGPDFRSADTPPEMQGRNPAPVLMRRALVQRYQWPGLVARRTAVQAPRRYWRGRCIGGSSAIGGQLAIRGMLNDFDLWAAAGCKGWSGAEVLSSYRRLEHDLDYGFAGWHGDSGPLPIRRAPRAEWGAVDRALAQAGLDLGYGWADDHNAPDATGVSPCAINSTIEGRRVSTSDGYLEPARARPNLRILGEALVDRVIIEGHWPRATGVRVLIDGTWRDMRADQTILCAGAIHSPAILMRSGIGRSETLFEAGVTPRVDLPVGENLQDHPAIALHIALKRHARPASPADGFTNCCIRYSSGLAGAGRNDVKLIGINQLGDAAAHRQGDDPIFPAAAVGLVGATLQQCFSRGRLTIASADPLADPLIDQNMLSDPRDMVRLRDATRRLIAVARHPAFARITESITLAGRSKPPESLADEALLDAWLRAESGDCQDIAGTCRMGPPDDRRAVVDPDCRVIGVEGLRVVDASIMPQIVRAATNLTVVMIAEHIAQRLCAAT